MKRTILIMFLITMVFIFDTDILNDSIYNIYYKIINFNNEKIISNKDLLNKNEYYKENLSSYIKEYENDYVYNKNDLINTYYTLINNGYDGITFYCDDSYENCLEDIKELDNEDDNLTHINQLVSVYNSYQSIKSIYSSTLRVNVEIERRYTDEDIIRINNEINRIMNKLNINYYEKIEDKIKLLHDYLADINNYDLERANNGESIYNSDTAIGALFEGKAVCSGYTDAMALFLDKLSLKNVRIASNNHVWNAVFINNEWKHIDLTWDDPVVSDGSNVIQYDYFLISTDILKKKNDTDHIINEKIYDFIK